MVQLNYKMFGEGHPMIIIHGLFGSLDNWLGIAKYIGSQGYKVYILDQRNHGKSPHTDDHNYKLMAEDLKGFIDEHEIKDPILVGHSMGGKTVMEFSNHYADLIKKLVVVDIGPKYYPPHHHTILRALNSLQINVIKKRSEAEEHLAQSINDAGVRMFLMKNLDRTGSDSFAWKMNLPTISKHIENVGQEITLDQPFEKPTLFIAGKNSDYILPEDKPSIKTLYPTMDLIYIKNAGHWVHAEQTEAFVGTLLNFSKS